MVMGSGGGGAIPCPRRVNPLLCLLTPPQAFVFCCAHADLIKRYLADSKWAHSRDMKVRACGGSGGGGSGG